MLSISNIKSMKTPKNIFLLGSIEEHSILKEWAENDIQNRPSQIMHYSSLV